MIQDRFGVSDLPDSFVYLPEQLGGLGLRNPFVGLFLIRNEVTQTPEDIIKEYLKDERNAYLESKKSFEVTSEQVLRRRLHQIYPREELAKQKALPESELNTFFSLEEYSRFRERLGYNFYKTFDKLVSVPDTEEIALSKEVSMALRESHYTVKVDSEKKWFLQLYAKSLLQDFGGLSLVDKQFLPVGVLAMMRGKKVSWNMVL